MVSYGSSFVRGEYQEPGRAMSAAIEDHLEENNISPDSEEGARYRESQRKSNPVGHVAGVGRPH